MAQRFEVLYSAEPDFRIGDYDGQKYGDTHGSLKQAMAAAEQAVRAGLHGVYVMNDSSGGYEHIVPYCKTVTQGRQLPDGGRYWPTFWCVRHDLHTDGKCAEHTEGGMALPSAPEQLALSIGGAA